MPGPSPEKIEKMPTGKEEEEIEEDKVSKAWQDFQKAKEKFESMNKRYGKGERFPYEKLDKARSELEEARKRYLTLSVNETVNEAFED